MSAERVYDAKGTPEQRQRVVRYVPTGGRGAVAGEGAVREEGRVCRSTAGHLTGTYIRRIEYTLSVN